MNWYILADNGTLHRAESGHIAGPSFSDGQITDWAKYTLCHRPGCFPEAPEAAKSSKVAKEPQAAPEKKEV